MKDLGVPGNDMRTFPWRPRPEVRILDALCSGTAEPGEAPARLRPVAEVLASLQAPPDRSESAGWDQALTAYLAAAAIGLPPASCRMHSQRPGVIRSLFGAKLATAGAAAAVAALGGGIAAAYTGSLPAGLQRFTHDMIAAPDAGASHPAPAGNGAAGAGPSATGSAAYGLCNAYQHAQAHGNATQRAVAFRNLVNAAGGASRVAAYCAQVPHPGASHPGNATSPGHQAGPTRQAGLTHPAHHGKPTAAASNGKPTAAASNGKPTAAASNDNSGGNGQGKGKES